MNIRNLCTTIFLFFTTILAQDISASNNTQDLPAATNSPRFFVNSTDIHFQIAPLGVYAQISHSNFVSIVIQGRLTLINTSNVNTINSYSFAFLSCDADDYTGNLSPDTTFGIVVNSQRANSLILYSKYSDHCAGNGLTDTRVFNGIFTTTNASGVAHVLSQLASSPNGLGTTIYPDLSSFTNSSLSGSYDSAYKPPTTNIAMIVLYTITGVITFLFVIIIITGAVRAHRHPERYGPRNIVGRPRQSRAKGIARAMLETLPIVKFGDQVDQPRKTSVGDVEMHTNAEKINADKSVTVNSATEVSEADANKTDPILGAISASGSKPDGTDDDGQLGCSICTEDFNKGEEVRVLPCNHKFHPECVDPWLLNVSGTCPLCRIDLRPKEEQERDQQRQLERQQQSLQRMSMGPDALLAPPLGASRMSVSNTRRETISALRQSVGGSREERVAALRRLRDQRRTARRPNTAATLDDSAQPTDEDSRGLARRFRERFRIRTRRQGETDGAEPAETTQGPSRTPAGPSLTGPA